jgi:hypothetical protein
MMSGVDDNVSNIVMQLTRDCNMTAIIDANVSKIVMQLTQDLI